MTLYYESFDINNYHLNIVDTDNAIVLFHDKSKESYQDLKLWYDIKNRVITPIKIMNCDLTDDRIDNLIIKIKKNKEHPYHKFIGSYEDNKNYILYYRNGKVIASYKGDKNIDSIFELMIMLNDIKKNDI